jgi:hypothetical protein
LVVICAIQVGRARTRHVVALRRKSLSKYLRFDCCGVANGTCRGMYVVVRDVLVGDLCGLIRAPGGNDMFRRRESGSFSTAVADMSSVAVATVAVVAFGGGVSSHVRADAATISRSPAMAFDYHGGGGDQRDGNGEFNRISAPFNSPNFMRGVQHVINANSGGRTINQSGICKKRSHCKLSQRAYMGGW